MHLEYEYPLDPLFLSVTMPVPSVLGAGGGYGGLGHPVGLRGPDPTYRLLVQVQYILCRGKVHYSTYSVQYSTVHCTKYRVQVQYTAVHIVYRLQYMYSVPVQYTTVHILHRYSTLQYIYCTGTVHCSTCTVYSYSTLQYMYSVQVQYTAVHIQCTGTVHCSTYSIQVQYTTVHIVYRYSTLQYI